MGLPRAQVDPRPRRSAETDRRRADLDRDRDHHRGPGHRHRRLAPAAIFTGLALILHFDLAANDDGSWTDVALDAFALVTLGAVKLLSSGAKTMLAIREGSAGFAETSTAARTAFAQANGVGPRPRCGSDGATRCSAPSTPKPPV